ncbi:hypothetical protein TrLO_g279 [Triparma laevis f. longispina]|uniref:Uncharacterized protein n=1 Tax=Triparma laevis f. longispina TaxID=1714387 RepID=A0A9W7FMD6_9STRA|nr:hypothetical protein TrLO_g279 [Triparma laevis f. longispina]
MYSELLWLLVYACLTVVVGIAGGRFIEACPLAFAKLRAKTVAPIFSYINGKLSWKGQEKIDARLDTISENVKAKEEETYEEAQKVEEGLTTQVEDFSTDITARNEECGGGGNEDDGVGEGEGIAEDGGEEGEGDDEGGDGEINGEEEGGGRRGRGRGRWQRGEALEKPWQCRRTVALTLSS